MKNITLCGQEFYLISDFSELPQSFSYEGSVFLEGVFYNLFVSNNKSYLFQVV